MLPTYRRCKVMRRLTIVQKIGFLVTFCFLFSSSAATFQSVTVSTLVPAVGGADSGSPLISTDGRYVVFGSAAYNLLLTTNGNPVRSFPISKLNVYVRDRS